MRSNPDDALRAAVQSTLLRLADGRGAAFEDPRTRDAALWRAFVLGARRWDAVGALLAGGPAGQCHRTTAALWRQDPTLGLVWGYALAADAWAIHSWLATTTGIVEPGRRRPDGYVGVRLSPALALAFARDEARLAFEEACDMRGHPGGCRLGSAGPVRRPVEDGRTE